MFFCNPFPLILTNSFLLSSFDFEEKFLYFPSYKCKDLSPDVLFSAESKTCTDIRLYLVLQSFLWSNWLPFMTSASWERKPANHYKATTPIRFSTRDEKEKNGFQLLSKTGLVLLCSLQGHPIIGPIAVVKMQDGFVRGCHWQYRVYCCQATYSRSLFPPHRPKRTCKTACTATQSHAWLHNITQFYSRLNGILPAIPCDEPFGYYTANNEQTETSGDGFCEEIWRVNCQSTFS